MSLAISSDDLDELRGHELTGQARPGGERAGGRAEGGPPLRYRLDRRIGGGAQGVVFLAARLAEGVEDAAVVKVWRPSFVAQNAEIAELVLRKESIALARLNERVPPTPYVVRLLDGGELPILRRFGTTSLPWLALEYVHGGALGTTLRERVRESVAQTGVSFSPARARRVLGCIVEGVSAIHEVGVIHRDLKPTNVLVCGTGDDELAKVADFGLARPVGMAGTFGSAIAVGTPGFAAPEQFESSQIGPWSDVFSLAALAYFVIAGEDMFGGSPTMQMARAYAGQFEHLATRPHLDAGWKSVRALPRIEDLLRRATLRDLKSRIPSVSELWGALEPAIADAASAGSITHSAGSARTLRDAAARPWTFHVVHQAKTDLGLRAVAFDPDGHALASGATGLWYWEGARWLPLQAPPGVDASAIRYLKRLAPRRWLAAGDDGQVAVFTPERCVSHQRLGPGTGQRPSLVAGSVFSERHFAVAGRAPGSPPILLAFVDGAWRPPAFLPDAQEITAVASAGPLGWHLVGHDAQGRGLLFTYRADTGAVTPWPIESAALLAAATDSSGALFAVGAGGFAFRQQGGHPVLERVLSHRPLTAVAVDPADCAWAAAVGRILRRPAGASGGTWSPIWSDATATRPFIGMSALAGLIMAATDDGSIVAGHQPE